MYYLYGNLPKKCSCFCPLSQLTKKFIECFITYLNVNYFYKSTIKPDYSHYLGNRNLQTFVVWLVEKIDYKVLRININAYLYVP